MDRELQRYLMAAFPREERFRDRRSGPEETLVIRGYRVPADQAVDPQLMQLLANLQPGSFRPVA